MKIYRIISFIVLFLLITCGKSIKVLNCEQTENQYISTEVCEESKGRSTLQEGNRKKVFLTFDDGPSQNTLKILNILKENNVRGTFFIIGKMAEANPDLIKKLHESGMCVASHSYSHDYKIYKSANSYFDDLFKCDEIIYRITGSYSVPFIRFPAGSYNTLYGKAVMMEIKSQLKSRGINYVDWNVSSADTASESVPKDIIKSNIVNQCSLWDVSVALMHDAAGKKTTVEALPEIISALKAKGYEFKTFRDISPREKQEMIRLSIMNR
jgi:peptidoglycan-N-acetylglucosamine deacetylase